MSAPALDDEFAQAVRAGLMCSGQKTLPCQYLYDDVGSALFEAITYLDEYGLTRADARVVRDHAAELAQCLPRDLLITELGSGTGSKTRAILESLRDGRSVQYFAIDLAPTALAKCVQELAGLVPVRAIEKSYLDGFREVTGRRAPGQSLLVLFLGSTIGNFAPESAVHFLCALRQHMLPGDALLLGTDLVKPVDLLVAAYDDPAGVTAAFNLNLLARINRELGGDFHLRRFRHEARYDQASQRVEMHLRSRARQSVRIAAASLVVPFARGETILTEMCHKFLPEQIAVMARTAGFRLARQWVDAAWPFAENLLAVE